MSADHGHAAEAHGHDAPAADHGHGGGHDAPAADHGHGGGHEAHGHDAHGSGGNQVQQIRDKIDAERSKIGGKLKEKAGKAHGFLRFGKPGAPSKHNIAIEPVYAAGDMIDAGPGTIARRLWEPIAKVLGLAEATTNIAIDPPLHPIRTMKHPVKYGANFGRLFTISLAMYADLFNAIPRSIQELYERGIQRPVQRTIARVIPVIGKGIEKLTNGLGWIVEQPRRLTEWLSQPIYGWDDRMKALQGANF